MKEEGLCRIRLRQLEDIQNLVDRGDVTLAKELFSTLRRSGGGGGRGGSPSGRQPTTHTEDQGLLTVHGGLGTTTTRDFLSTTNGSTGSLTMMMQNMRTTSQRPDEGTATAHGLDGRDAGLLTTATTTNGMTRQSLKERSAWLQQRKSSFPASQIQKLSTEYHVPHIGSLSLTELDELIHRTEEDVRRLRDEVRKKSALFERLAPSGAVLTRNAKSLQQQVDEQRLAGDNELLVAKEKLAATMDERAAVLQRIELLRDKLTTVQRHTDTAQAVVATEQQALQETFSFLTHHELFHSGTTHDIEKLMEAKRKQIKEETQLLLRRRIHNEHSLIACQRQVEGKQRQLQEYQSHAVLFGSVPPPPTTAPPPLLSSSDSEEGSSVTHSTVESPLERPSWATPAHAPLLPTPSQESSTKPKPRASKKKSHPTAEPPTVTQPQNSSVYLLQQASTKRSLPPLRNEVEGKHALPTNPLIRLKLLKNLQQNCQKAEATDRDALTKVFQESWAHLLSTIHAMRLELELRETSVRRKRNLMQSLPQARYSSNSSTGAATAVVAVTGQSTREEVEEGVGRGAQDGPGSHASLLLKSDDTHVDGEEEAEEGNEEDEEGEEQEDEEEGEEEEEEEEEHS